MPNEIPISFWDSLVKALLGVLWAILGYLWRDTRTQIAELRERMDAQDKALAVLQSTVDGRQALMLEKMEGMERKLEGVSHVLGTMSDTLIQLRLEQARKDG